MRYHLRVIFRSLMRFKAVFFINLSCLTLGLAAALLIYLWVDDELHVDRFYENSSSLFQVMNEDRQDDQINISDGTSPVLCDALKKEFPEVAYGVATTPDAWFRHFDVTYNNAVVNARGNFAGKDYFQVFTYSLLAGDKNSALAEPNTIAISRSMAEKLFQSSTNAIGKTINWKWLSFSRDCLITGVYEDMPSNASARFDFLISLITWKSLLPGSGGGNGTENLNGGPFKTYIVLREHTDKAAFQEKLAAFLPAHVPGIKTKLKAASYADFYLHGQFVNGEQSGGRIAYVKLFSFIAVFILVIACINFINLSTARVSENIRQTGIRKVLGAGRQSLVMQYLGEAVFMTTLAMIAAILLVAILLPWFNTLTDKQIVLHADARILITVLIIILTTGITAGIYPALYLSGFNPVRALKGAINPSANSVLLRKGLVGFQFVLSFVFIVMVLVIYSQVKYIHEKQPGYNKDNVMCFEMTGKVAERPDVFIAGLQNLPGVVKASSIMNSIILPTFTPLPGVYWEGKNQDDAIRFYQMAVNYNLIEVLGIEMKTGRSFSKEFGADTSAIVLNEAAVNAMGIENPVGKTISVWGQQRRIIGVTKNFHFNSLHETVHPFIFKLEPASTLLIMARISGANQANTISAIGQFYHEFNPGFSLSYTFLNEDYQAQYKAETFVSELAKYFAGMAIIISCLGLFGLAAFLVERKTKEIGIRKILGAGVGTIVYLLSAEFTKIVLWAVLVGMPVSYWVCTEWLHGFAYHIFLTPVYFIIGVGITLITAWITISVQTIRAASSIRFKV